MTPFNAYRFSVALSNHFRHESFDFFQSRDALKLDRSKFDHSNARFRYEKLAKDLKDFEIRDFLLANLLNDPKWTIFDSSSQSRYLRFKGAKSALNHHFRNDVKKMYQYAKDHDMSYENIFEDIEGNCLALNCYLGGEIGVFTFVILDSIKPFIDKLVENDAIKKSLCQTAVKFRPFVKIDEDEFIKIESEFRY